MLDSSKQMNPQVSLVSSFILQLFGSKTLSDYYKQVLLLEHLLGDLHSHFGRHWRVNYYSSCS